MALLWAIANFTSNLYALVWAILIIVLGVRHLGPRGTRR